jgi:hypothetical protein
MTDTLDWSTLLRMLTHLKSNFNINMENKKILHCRNINKNHRTILERGKILPHKYIRDRPFNLQGGGELRFFVLFSNFFSDNTRVKIFVYFSREARIFFPEFNIRLYDKHSESDYFFFLHQNQNIFFSNIGNQNIFFRKKS